MNAKKIKCVSSHKVTSSRMFWRSLSKDASSGMVMLTRPWRRVLYGPEDQNFGHGFNGRTVRRGSRCPGLSSREATKDYLMPISN